MRDLFYGNCYDFNDAALRLMGFYNRMKPQGDRCQLQYFNTIHLCTVHAYSFAVNNYFNTGSIHNGHWCALAFSFLQVTHFFSGEFCMPQMCERSRRNLTMPWPPRMGRTSGTECLNFLVWMAGWRASIS